MDNCSLLDGRAAVTTVAGFAICQHHVDVLAGIKADAESRARKYLARPKCRQCGNEPAGPRGGLGRECVLANKRATARAYAEAGRKPTGRKRGRPSKARAA